MQSLTEVKYHRGKSLRKFRDLDDKNNSFISLRLLRRICKQYFIYVIQYVLRGYDTIM